MTDTNFKNYYAIVPVFCESNSTDTSFGASFGACFGISNNTGKEYPPNIDFTIMIVIGKDAADTVIADYNPKWNVSGPPISRLVCMPLNICFDDSIKDVWVDIGTRLVYTLKVKDCNKVRIGKLYDEGVMNEYC